ncbi:IBR domain containing protein [Beauveria brongniartii RCEF 3172]|uniref:IBR domain containing protein n=1 Tax=Beauveria brongniartii RCEF 3172 TaxID=1081107 RepID=A0A167EYV3_9HYPO|nr:IBR domain containing protein [Beauveria brongniartii RCEF 3172]
MAYPIDIASLDLIAKLQLEDAESLLKGKHAAGTRPDAEYAAQLFRDELEQIRISIADNAMCRSIAAAVLADSDAIQSSLNEEHQANCDREYAANLDSMDPDSDDVDLANISLHTPSAASLIDDEMMGKLAIMFVDAGELPGRASRTVRGESSSQGAKAGRYGTRRCISCEEDVSYIDSVRCPCSHDYCRTCIASLFEAAISDESLFPARCCRQAIPLGLNQILIPAELAGRYRAKEVEYGTLNRTYCHRSSCSTFVPPQFVRGRRHTRVTVSLMQPRWTCFDWQTPAAGSDAPPAISWWS